MRSGHAARTVNIAFKILLILVIASGVITELARADSAYGFFNTFFFFTYQSNLIVLAVAVYGVYRLLANRPERRLGTLIRNGAVLWILITCLVYNFMLGGPFKHTGPAAWVSWSLHYIAPLLTVLNWLFFEEKGKSRYVDTVLWLIYPLAYAAVAEARYALDRFAPYWFLDPGRPSPKGAGSIWTVLAIIGAMLVFFGLLGLLIIRIDRFWKKKAQAAASGAAEINAKGD